MWNTTLGCRVLKDAEARFVCGAAHRLIDEIRTSMPQEGETGEKMEIGIVLFDRMTPEQQLVLIDRVIGYLLDPTLDAPPRTALMDATVAAIYVQAYHDIEYEIDSQQMARNAEDGDTEARQQIADALMEAAAETDERKMLRPDAECVVAETWEFAIDRLRDRVLPDEDWNMADETLDLPPTTNMQLKKGMGIAKDYFIDIPPESTRADARNAWANLIEKFTDERPPLWRFGDLEIHPVLLADLISEMEIQPEGWSTFVNKTTGEIVGLPSDVFKFLDSGEEDDDEYFGDAPKEVLEVGRQINNERDHYVALPDQFDIHEWAIMRKFCDSMDSAELRSELLAAIHGSGAFRHFKATLHQLNLRDDWFRFRDHAMEQIAIEWLDYNEIPWARTKRGDAALPEE